jgi:uncharacterized spore protein YtfJ
MEESPMEQGLTQYVDSLFTNMKSFAQDDGLIGKPVVQGDKTFLPVISITLGYGGGDSHTKGKQETNAPVSKAGSMMGDAMGVGAKLCTDAVIVIDKGNVLLAPIGPKAGMTQVLEKIPQIMNSINAGGQQNNQQQQQQQPQGNQGY